MGDHKNLSNSEAIEKLKSMAENQTCLFCTYTGPYRLEARPMSTNKVKDDGTIYFLSEVESDKNIQIKSNSKVDLLYSGIGGDEYLSVRGNAEILTDKELIKELWTPIAKVWFTEGVDDPRITVIKFTPEEAYYWDTKNGKMISFLKMIASVITGQTMDGGIEGSLKV